MRYALSALSAAVLSVFRLLAGSDAHATDQGITGRKLLLKSTKFVPLSKDASIHLSRSHCVSGRRLVAHLR